MQTQKGMLVLVFGLCLIAALVLLQRKPDSYVVENPVAIMQADGTVSVIFTLKNSGGPDLLLEAGSTAADVVQILRPEGIDTTPIPQGSSVSFSEDGVILRVSGLKAPLDEGAMLPISLTFNEAGTVSFRARATRNTDAGKSIEEVAMAQICTLEESGTMASEDNTATDLLRNLTNLDPPAVSIRGVTQADNGGWDLDLEVENFVFRRIEDMTPHVPGQGHGHIYLNGLKIGRLYADQATIGRLPPGIFTVSVSLNRNDHAPYRVDGIQLTTQTQFSVQ